MWSSGLLDIVLALLVEYVAALRRLGRRLLGLRLVVLHPLNLPYLT